MRRVPTRVLIAAAAAAVAATGLVIVFAVAKGEGKATAKPEAATTAPAEEPSPQPPTPTKPPLALPDTALATVREMVATADAGERRRLRDHLGRLLRAKQHRLDATERDAWLAILRDAKPESRIVVGDALGMLEGDADTATALLGLLENAERETRRALYTALGGIKAPAAVPALAGRLAAGDPDANAIVLALVRIGTPDIPEKLFALLGEPIGDDARHAIEEALQGRATPEIARKAADALEGAEGARRRSYVRVLGGAGDPAHTPKVLDLLARETDPLVRSAAIEALGRIGDPAAGKKLLALANAPGQEQRAAIRSLGSVARADTLAELGGGWGDMTDDARLALMRAAERLEDPGDALLSLAREKAITSPNAEVRLLAAGTLGRKGREEGVEALAGLAARTAEPRERTAALRALHAIGTRLAAERAIGMLHLLADEKERQDWLAKLEKVRAAPAPPLPRPAGGR